jgi:hypothetical protein
MGLFHTLMNHSQKHDYYLNSLIHHLDYVGISKPKVSFVLKEPTWFDELTSNSRSLCDLIIGHNDGSCSALELKGCRAKRGKAKLQLKAGKTFIEEYLRLPYRDSLFVVYESPMQYYVERYHQ